MREFYYSQELAEQQKKLGIAPQYFVNQAGQRVEYNMSAPAGGKLPADWKEMGLKQAPVALGQGEPERPIYGRSSGQAPAAAYAQAYGQLPPELAAKLEQDRAARRAAAGLPPAPGGDLNARIEEMRARAMLKAAEARSHAPSAYAH